MLSTLLQVSLAAELDQAGVHGYDAASGVSACLPDTFPHAVQMQVTTEPVHRIVVAAEGRLWLDNCMRRAVATSWEHDDGIVELMCVECRRCLTSFCILYHAFGELRREVFMRQGGHRRVEDGAGAGP